MGYYRARDLLLPPNLLSLARVPLAVVFPFVVRDPGAALAVLAAAAATDVLDGWIARAMGQATATGAVVDGLTDKAFAATVVVTLLVTGHLAPLGALMLVAREIGELPLVLWWTVSRHRRRGRASNPRANLPGKLATVLQFAAVVGAITHAPHLPPLLAATATAGAVAAATYWRRELTASG